jgi:hypothetical protein
MWLQGMKSCSLESFTYFISEDYLQRSCCCQTFPAYRCKLFGAMNSAGAAQHTSLYGTFLMQMAYVRQRMYSYLPDFTSSLIPARENLEV